MHANDDIIISGMLGEEILNKLLKILPVVENKHTQTP